MANFAMWLAVFCFGLVTARSNALGFLNDVIDGIGDTYSCNGVCENTFALHTYETGSHLTYCMRGCRLFTIIDFINNDENLNHTKEACYYSCKEAYSEEEDLNACKLGCDAQVQDAEKRRGKLQQLSNEEDPFLPLYPFLYVHNWYSNIFDKMVDKATVTWTFYLQGSDGKLIVAKSEPHVYIPTQQQQRLYAFPMSNDFGIDEDKTSNYMETNLAFVDNSATPNLKHSQVQFSVRGDSDEMSLGANDSSDWLSCISKKTGFPRLLLSCTLFLSAVVMIWLCFTTAATAPEHRIRTKSEKLSIYGDLDLLKEFDVTDLAPIHIQEKTGLLVSTDDTQAPPLPIKVKVESV